MKKLIIWIIMAVLIGSIYGKLMFDQYEKKAEVVFNPKEEIFILQQGVYSSLDNVSKYTTKLPYYIVEKDEQYYRVYAAITKKESEISKLKGIYIKAGNDIYVRELTLDNEAFLEVLEQYDKLLVSSSDDEQIIQIEKQVLSKYKELVLDNE